MRRLYRFEAMTTPCEVILVADERSRSDACAKAILSEAKRLEKKYSYYDPASLLHAINRRETERIDSETKMLLQRAQGFCKTTNGIFDITVATVKELYRGETDPGVLARKREELLPFTGCGRFSVKKGRIRFDNPHTRIDLGGFVKEYAVDRAAAIVKKHRITAALINFGGDIYALGRKENGERFRIGIKDPRNPDRHIAFFDLENAAIATSASYDRHYTIGDETHSHIIPTTRKYAPPLSATVIAPDCVESGVYATALMIDPTLKVPHRTYIVT